MHYLCSRYSLSSKNTLSRAHFALVTHETRSAGVSSALNEMCARLDSSTTGSKTHGMCLIPMFIVHHVWKNVWDAFKVDCAVRAILCAFIIFLPCASPPLVRTAMALPAPLIRSFSKSTCMMEDRRYKPFNSGKHGLIPLKASYIHGTQRTNSVGGALTYARLAPPIVCSARSCLEQQFSACFWT